MKSMLLIIPFLIAGTALAQEAVLKECSVTMKQMDGSNETVDMTMQVIERKDKSLYAKVTQTVDGQTGSYEDIAVVSEEAVRADLSIDSDPATLNSAERLIVHAMLLTSDPVFEGMFTAGVDLNKVRSAKMYTVGETGNMGSSTVVEAKDEKGQILGSFLGGFLVSPCK